MTSEIGTQARSLAEDRSFLLELSQLRAKATLTEMLGRSPNVRWTFQADRVVRNLAVLHVALASHLLGPDETVVERSAGIAAQAWESLASLADRVDRRTALMNASFQYELAGYQANAACVARLASDRRQWTSDPTLTGVASAFAQRLFLRTRILADVLRTPPREVADDLDLLRRAATATTAGALDHAARYFLSGDDRELATATERLDAAYSALADASLLPDVSLVSGLRALLPQMAAKSTWRTLSPFGPGVPRWERYLRVLARGLGSTVVDSRSVSELWPSQRRALESGLLDGTGNVVVRMPTSGGKTRVAEMAIVHTLATRRDARALYVAPFRALVNEVTESFSNLFTDLGLSAASIVGAFEQDDVEQVFAEQQQLLVLTPEKLDLVLRLDPAALDGVELVALDEGQLAGDPTRGAKYELLVARLRRRLPQARFLLLSAVVPDQTLADFAEWMQTEPGRVVSTRWRPTAQRVAALEWRDGRGVLRYARGAGQEALERFLPGLIEERTFEYVNPETGRINHRRFPAQGSKSQIAAAVAYEVAGRGPVLVFCAQTTWARSVANALLDRIEYALLSEEEVPTVFRAEADRPERLASLAIAREWLGNGSLVARLLARGIGLHYGRLPDAVREAIEEDFRARRLAVLIATSTLAQGVNLPVRTVVFHSCWRSDDSGQTRLMAREYWNVAGRAGRAGEETEGTVIHIVTSPNDRRDFQYFLDHRGQVEEVTSVLLDYLTNLVNRRISPDAVGEALDSEILAIVAEEGDEDLGAAIESILSQSLCSVQAARRRWATAPLAGAMTSAGARIAALVTDPHLRRTYSATGLSTESCETIRMHVQEHGAALRDLLVSESPESQQEVVRLAVEALAGVSEMSDMSGYAGDFQELVERWLDGSPVAQIVNVGSQTDSDEFAHVVEQVLTYLLPWGSSAYLRIARVVLQAGISEAISVIPALLKYGAPNAEAAWIQGAGIRSRQLSIELARRYRAVARPRTAADVTRWLSQLDADELIAEFGVQPSVAASAARAIFRSSRSELLDLYEEGALFPYTATFEATRRARDAGVLEDLRPGGELSLKRDYASRVNRNSVRLETSGRLVGYLPWDLARVLAVEMDAGRSFQATLAAIEPAHRSITIEVSEATPLAGQAR